MRLLMTTDTVGGVWTFTCELSEELLQRGHAIALVSFGPSPSPEQSAWIAAQQTAFPDRFRFTAAAGVPLEWEQNNSTAFTAGDPVLAETARLFRPELLLSNQFCFGAASVPVPRIIVAHSDVLSWARAAKPSALEPTPWLNQYTALVQGGLLQAQAIVAPTAAAMRDLKRNFYLPAAPYVIPNGRRISPAQAEPARKLQAVTAGRLWDEAKGLQFLTEAELPLPVLVAGETGFSEEIAPAPPPNVHRLGPLAPQALQQLFRESALYLCTSVYEPFGLAPLEAALCGCAIVARDLPSLREVWGEDAFYFRNTEDLRTELQTLVSQPAVLASAQQRAHRRASQYTVERMADAYLAVLAAILQPRTQHVA